jgi:hypothetical protein
MAAKTMTSPAGGGPVKRSEATDSEAVRYMEAGLEAQDGLNAAIILLKTKQVLTADPDESRQITVRVLELQSEVGKIQSELIAFRSEQSAIRPPNDAEVNSIKSVARSLDGMIASKVLTGAIVKAATDLAQAFAATRA